MSDKLQAMLEHSNRESDAMEQSADRAERRLEPATAILYRNEAWRIRQGREWLESAYKENI